MSSSVPSSGNGNRTVSIMASLQDALKTNSTKTMIEEISKLSEEFRDPSQVDLAVNRNLLELLPRLLAVENTEVHMELIKMLSGTVISLCNCVPFERTIELTGLLTRVLWDNVLHVSGRSRLCEPVFRAIFQLSKSGESFKLAFLESCPLTALRELEVMDYSAQTLDNFANAIINIYRKNKREVSHREVLEVLTNITDGQYIKCSTLSAICACLYDIIGVENPVLPLIWLSKSEMIANVVKHFTKPGGNCDRGCVQEFVNLTTLLMAIRSDLSIKFIAQGFLQVISAVLNDPTLKHSYFNAALVVSQCLVAGSLMVDVVLNQKLLNPLVVLVKHERAVARDQALTTVTNFLTEARQPQLVRAVESGLFGSFRDLLSTDSVPTLKAGLGLLEKTLRKAAEFKIVPFIVKKMLDSDIHILVRQLFEATDENVQQLAVTVAGKLEDSTSRRAQ